MDAATTPAKVSRLRMQPEGRTGKRIKAMQIRKQPLISLLSAIAVVAMLSCWLAAPARAEEVRAGDLVITQAWSRATPGGAKIGGGYLTIENRGSVADRLTGGSADVASSVQVHEMSVKDGVMTMRPLDKGLAIEPGKTVKLAPGGYHLMLHDLKGPLKQGDKLPVTLEFEKAGRVKVSFDVQGIGAQGPAGGVNSDGPVPMKKMPDGSGMKM
jgi:copper(I)-binding protein